jgi:hypothetical protein
MILAIAGAAKMVIDFYGYSEHVVGIRPSTHEEIVALENWMENYE